MNEIYINKKQQITSGSDISIKNNDLDDKHNRKPIVYYEKIISKLRHKKYLITDTNYNIKVINDIVFNRKSHVVTLFKNYLIDDDDSEFLKRYYLRSESTIRLHRFFVYYETYSKIFPNYTSLRESKFIYKNIHKKQKMIDQQQEKENEEESAHNHKNAKAKANNSISNDYNDDLDENKKLNEVFSTEVYNSIVNDNEDIALLLDLKKDKEDIEKHLNDLIDKISILEIRNETMEDASLSKVTSTPKQNNLLYNSTCASSKQSPINKSINQFKSQFQFQYPHQLFKFNHSNNNKQSIESKNSSNDPIVFNRLDNEKHIIANPNVSKLSKSVLPQATLKYTSSSLRPLTYREGSCDSIKANRNNLIESNWNSPNNLIRTKFKIAINNQYNTAKLTKDIISQIKGNNCLYFQSKLIEALYQQNLRLARDSINDKDKNHVLSPLASSQKSAIMNGKNISYRNNQGIIQFPTTDRMQSINQAKINMITQLTRNKAIQNNLVNKNLNHNSKGKKICIIVSKSNTKSIQQINLENEFSHLQKQNKLTNKKSKEIISRNQLQEASSIRQFPIKGIQIRNFDKALGLIETLIPNTKTNSERALKSILR